MTLLEMRTEVKRRIREASASVPEATGSGVYFSDRDVDDAINDGYMEMSDQTEWFEETLDLSLVTSRPYYDLFSIIGCFFLSIKPAFDRQTNRWLVPSTVRGLDNNDRRWERVVGEPQRIFLRGLRWLGIYPRIHSDGNLIKLYYTRLPEPLCADTDEPGFPETYHDGCVHFAIADLFAQDAETKFALDSWQDYLFFETGLQQWVDSREDRPLTRILGSATVPR